MGGSEGVPSLETKVLAEVLPPVSGAMSPVKDASPAGICQHGAPAPSSPYHAQKLAVGVEELVGAVPEVHHDHGSVAHHRETPWAS